MEKDNNLDELRNISIHSILGLRNNGRTEMIRCPFDHKDSTPSCAINSNNTFKCFGCNQSGGGAIDFVMATGCTFKEAVEELKSYL
jgi:DNA primase